MLSLDAFLARILPSSGDIVVVQLNGGIPVHHAFTSIPQAVAKIRALEQSRANIYIALAGYKPGSVKTKRGRTQENAERFRSVWLARSCPRRNHLRRRFKLSRDTNNARSKRGRLTRNRLPRNVWT